MRASIPHYGREWLGRGDHLWGRNKYKERRTFNATISPIEVQKRSTFFHLEGKEGGGEKKGTLLFVVVEPRGGGFFIQGKGKKNCIYPGRSRPTRTGREGGRKGTFFHRRGSHSWKKREARCGFHPSKRGEGGKSIIRRKNFGPSHWGGKHLLLGRPEVRHQSGRGRVQLSYLGET